MTAELASSGRKLAFKGLFIQLLTASCLLILSVLYRSSWLTSVILGIIAYSVPYIIFAYWVFRYAGGTKNNIVAQSFNQGMKLKLILTVTIFGLAFLHFNAHPLPLIGAYAMLMVAQATAMFYFSRRAV